MKSQAQDIIPCVQWKTRQERLIVSSGGADPRDAEEAAAAANPSGIAGTGITVFAQIRSASNAVPPPPPETFGASPLAHFA